MQKHGRSIAELLSDIVTWGERIERFVGGKSLDDFLTDEIRQLAVAKCVEIIGEASSSILRLHPGFAAEHPELDVVEAYRMRNRLAHGYDTIDWRIVWDTATVYVPTLVARVRTILSARDA
jgi:uncharacterized protein with HEPN domain